MIRWLRSISASDVLIAACAIGATVFLVLWYLAPARP